MPFSHEHIGSKIPAKIQIYILTRAELLITLCYEIPCTWARMFKFKLLSCRSSITRFALKKSGPFYQLRVIVNLLKVPVYTWEPLRSDCGSFSRGMGGQQKKIQISDFGFLYNFVCYIFDSNLAKIYYAVGSCTLENTFARDKNHSQRAKCFIFQY